jgi:hypothetical protein
MQTYPLRDNWNRIVRQNDESIITVQGTPGVAPMSPGGVPIGPVPPITPPVVAGAVTNDSGVPITNDSGMDITV